MSRLVLRSAVSALTVLLTTSVCGASGQMLLASDTGAYDDTGLHFPGNYNYITGYCGASCGVTPSGKRSYFLFDLSGYEGIVTGASLSSPTFTSNSPDASETFELHAVTTSAMSLDDGSAGLAGYTDLSDGTLLGTKVVTFPVAPGYIVTPLNQDGVAAVKAATGDLILGGQLATLTSSPGTDELLFAASNIPDVVNLIIDDASCPDEPAAGCATPGKSILKFKNNADPAKKGFGWKWLNGDAMASNFGSPLTTTAYAFCVYGDGGLILSSALVAPADGWKGSPSVAPVKFKYKPESPNEDGVTQLQFKPGTGKAKIQIKGKGANVEMPTLPTMATQLRVQFLVDSATGSSCWESSFTSPFTKDDEKGLVAK